MISSSTSWISLCVCNILLLVTCTSSDFRVVRSAWSGGSNAAGYSGSSSTAHTSSGSFSGTSGYGGSSGGSCGGAGCGGGYHGSSVGAGVGVSGGGPGTGTGYGGPSGGSCGGAGCGGGYHGSNVGADGGPGTGGYGGGFHGSNVGAGDGSGTGGGYGGAGSQGGSFSGSFSGSGAIPPEFLNAFQGGFFPFNFVNPMDFQNVLQHNLHQLQDFVQAASAGGGGGISGASGGAQASGHLGPHGGWGVAKVSPAAHGGLDVRFGDSTTGPVNAISGRFPAPVGGEGVSGIFTSSSSSSETVNGQTKTYKTATVGVNDNGKVTTYTAHNP